MIGGARRTIYGRQGARRAARQSTGGFASRGLKVLPYRGPCFDMAGIQRQTEAFRISGPTNSRQGVKKYLELVRRGRGGY